MTFFIALASGLIFSFLFPQNISHVKFYEIFLYTLLGIGLYGSVYGINLKEFYAHKMLIFRAITVGVLFKSLIIGGILWLFFQSPYVFIFAIIVAQIDPLSVAHLIENKSSMFSSKGRTILRAWSSFDDPMTVLLAFYLFLPLTIVMPQVFGIHTYAYQLLANLLFAGIVYLFSKTTTQNTTKLGLIGLVFIIGISLKLMLGLALIGLFLRPEIVYLPLLIRGAFIIAAFLLGSLLEFTSMSILYGIILGISAFGSQAIVTFLIASKLSWHDKIFLSVAQYNGITAIILALIISQWIPQVVSIVAIAIITINVLYYFSNWLVEKKLVKKVAGD